MASQDPAQKQGSSTESSFYTEPSTLLKSKHLPRPHARLFFNFILTSPLNEVRTFFVTVVRKKFPSVFYAYDSSSFCLLRCSRRLRPGQRYIIYGKLAKNRLYFLECLKEEEVDYKELCYMLL